MIASSTFIFVAFGVLVALIMAARPSLAWRQNVFLGATLVFVATLSRNPLALVPLLAFLLVGHLAIRVAARLPHRTFGVAIAGVVLLFFWLKRYTIIPSSLWIPYGYVTIGLSYVLFRLLHLIIESHNDETLARLSLGDYVRYVVGFTTFVAGPIMFYDEYVAEQRAMANGASLEDVGEGVQRIVVGLFKATVLAALLSALRADALSTFHAGGTVLRQCLAGAEVFALYPLFLYCNFSGYIDVVLGISRLMGQRLPENFDRPFSATSVIDFWNRWHITLSRWLKLYVFNPMLIALLRRFPSRSLEPLWATLAFFVTFSLVGAWHGQTTAFLVFGFLTGLGVSANKLYQVLMARVFGKKGYAGLAKSPLYRMFARGLTFTWFAFTLTFFWGTWRVATELWSVTGIKRWVAIWMMVVVVSSLLLALWEVVYTWWHSRESRTVSPLGALRIRTAWLTTLAVIVVVVVMLSSQSAPALVYKDF